MASPYFTDTLQLSTVDDPEPYLRGRECPAVLDMNPKTRPHRSAHIERSQPQLAPVIWGFWRHRLVADLYCSG